MFPVEVGFDNYTVCEVAFITWMLRTTLSSHFLRMYSEVLILPTMVPSIVLGVQVINYERVLNCWVINDQVARLSLVRTSVCIENNVGAGTLNDSSSD